MALSTKDTKWMVELTPPEMITAGMNGIMRRTKQIAVNSFSENHNWDSEIEGALAEAAVAKRLNLFNCSSVDVFKGGDVDQFQVRSTRHDDGGLILRPGDVKEGTTGTIYILVTGQDGIYTLRGWSRDTDVCAEAYWHDVKKPFWLMPQAEVVPMSELVKHHVKRRVS